MASTILDALKSFSLGTSEKKEDVPMKGPSSKYRPKSRSPEDVPMKGPSRKYRPKSRSPEDVTMSMPTRGRSLPKAKKDSPSRREDVVMAVSDWRRKTSVPKKKSPPKAPPPKKKESVTKTPEDVEMRTGAGAAKSTPSSLSFRLEPSTEKVSLPAGWLDQTLIISGKGIHARLRAIAGPHSLSTLSASSGEFPLPNICLLWGLRWTKTTAHLELSTDFDSVLLTLSPSDFRNIKQLLMSAVTPRGLGVMSSRDEIRVFEAAVGAPRRAKGMQCTPRLTL